MLVQMQCRIKDDDSAKDLDECLQTRIVMHHPPTPFADKHVRGPVW